MTADEATGLSHLAISSCSAIVSAATSPEFGNSGADLVCFVFGGEHKEEGMQILLRILHDCPDEFTQ